MLIVSLSAGALSQDTVNVTFVYSPPTQQTTVYLTGEFNNWNNTSWQMVNIGNNTFVRTVPLLIGGQPAGYLQGAYEYKFYYSGVSTWPNDPLNPRSDGARNGNSVLYVQNPTIYHFLPNQISGIVKTATPVFSAYMFPRIGTVLDTSSLTLRIDSALFNGIGKFYDFSTEQFQFQVPFVLRNGSHKAFISAGGVADSVTFMVQAGFVQITSEGGYPTWNPVHLIRGIVQDTSIHSAKIIRNAMDTTVTAVVAGSFAVSDTLTEGLNSFKALVDTSGYFLVSDSVAFTYLVNHTPFATVTETLIGSNVVLDASVSSDPDSQSLTYTWLDDSTHPLGIAGSHTASVTVSKPSVGGEYYFGLIAQDLDGNADTLRSYFVVKDSGSIGVPTIASNPDWARRARIYFLFPKDASAAGTINAASLRLPIIKAMGFNVVWLMPVVKNASPINNGTGPGYNIVDFYNVAPEYGTNQDFKNFVIQAHNLGLKVILDITPNHTSRFHPWSMDAHTFKQDSRYWTWYEHSIIPHNDNGLGQSLDADGFNYYSGFSEQLLNVNWKDVDARTEMINVYKYWIKNFGVDGYRFDVYWGPHRRYGEQYMGIPVRTALKHIKPDILLLGEDDGTGDGTEAIYADASGGLDAAYDFKLYFNAVRGFNFSLGGIDNLDSQVQNGGFYPGPNSLYMRFMESQDEDRITWFYSGTNFSIPATTTFERTMPMATVLFTVPGVPMIWNGQEVGWGYGIQGSKEARNRSIIDWTFQGNNLLMPHYQRLAQIRAQFPAFASQEIKRLNSGNSLVYAFTRPFTGNNGIVAVNMSASSQNVSLVLDYTNLAAPITDGKTYYLSNLYADSSFAFQFTGGRDSLSFSLDAYGSAVFIIADSIIHLNLPSLTSVERKEAYHSLAAFWLNPNYPNPFNPSTRLTFSLAVRSPATLKIYDILGREVCTLMNQVKEAGGFTVTWNGEDSRGIPVGSGVYFARLQAGANSAVQKLLLLR